MSMREFPANTDGPARSERFLDLLSGTAKNPVWLPVLSGSMRPTLEPGDEVLVAPCTPGECETGDIIVFRDGVTLTAHRLTRKFRLFRGAFFFQRGDGVASGGFIRPERIVGKCVASRRGSFETALTDRVANRAAAAKSRARLALHYARSVKKCLYRILRITR